MEFNCYKEISIFSCHLSSKPELDSSCNLSYPGRTESTKKTQHKTEKHCETIEAKILNSRHAKNQELDWPPQLAQTEQHGAAARLMADCSRRGRSLPDRAEESLRAKRSGPSFAPIRISALRAHDFSLLLFVWGRGEGRQVWCTCAWFVRLVSPLVGRSLHTWDYCKERMGLLFPESTSNFV